MANLPKIISEDIEFKLLQGKLEMLTKMIPYDVMQNQPKRDEIIPEKLDKVVVPEDKTQIDDSVSWYSLIKLYIKENLTNYILQSKQGDTNMPEGTALKDTIVGIVVRMILKYAGGALLALGITTGSATEVITAIVLAIVGFATSWYNNRKMLNSTPAPSVNQ